MSNLTYCEKCGHIGSSLFWNAQENGCFSCCAKETTKVIPEEYLSITGNTIEENLKIEFIEKFIKSSPNFDQECWNRRVGYQETRKHYDEILRNEMQGKNNVPKCPTCQSTNLKKITVTSKAMNTALFGLFGTKRHKTFHCNNCGYEW